MLERVIDSVACELSKDINPYNLKRLNKLYKSVYSRDLFTYEQYLNQLNRDADSIALVNFKNAMRISF